MTYPDIALMGYAQSGKDSVADRLLTRAGYKRVAFADPLKAMALNINPMVGLDCYGDGLPYYLADEVERDGWDRVKQTDEVRRFLQQLGQSFRVVDEDYWLNLALDKINATDDSTPVVVTDVRYLNEYEELRSRGFLMVRVERPGIFQANDHESESLIERMEPDIILGNAGSLDDLNWLVDNLLTSSAS